MDLVRQGRLAEARAEFEAGARAAPRDPRFPLELAGVAFLEKDHALAKRQLRRALALERGNAYGNEFLGTLYFLDGNPDAALKYWNRAGAPRLASIEGAGLGLANAAPGISPRLLNGILRFAPGDTLSWAEFRTARARLAALGGGPDAVRLMALPERRYGVRIAVPAEPMWWIAARSLSGAAFQSVTSAARNLYGSGVNVSGMLRWDAQKRRAFAAVSAPWRHSPKWRMDASIDHRRETWNTGGATDLRLRTTSGRMEFTAIESGRFSWTTGIEGAQRGFAGGDLAGGASPGAGWGAAGFESGPTLKHRTQARYRLLDLPEHGLTAEAHGEFELGRWFRVNPSRYTKARAGLSLRWASAAANPAWRLRARSVAGRLDGEVPFDEMFLVGMERDSDLWLRAHPGTSGGKKGSSPVGTAYSLVNLELERRLFRLGWLTVAAGPFLDAGRARDFRRQAAFRRWLIDGGAQVRLAAPGGLGLTFSYGRDLRAGRNAWYASPGLPFD